MRPLRDNDIRSIARLMSQLLKEQVSEQAWTYLQKDFLLSERSDVALFVRQLKKLEETQKQRMADALCARQIESKLWLLDVLKGVLPSQPLEVLVVGGWYGILGTLFSWCVQDRVCRVRSLDLDPDCSRVANRINQALLFGDGAFFAFDFDMLHFPYGGHDLQLLDEATGFARHERFVPNLVINTCAEHVADLSRWRAGLPKGLVVAVQSNNDGSQVDHVNCVESEQQLAEQLELSSCFFSGHLDLGKYKRFMVVGSCG